MARRPQNKINTQASVPVASIPTNPVAIKPPKPPGPVPTPVFTPTPVTTPTARVVQPTGIMSLGDPGSNKGTTPPIDAPSYSDASLLSKKQNIGKLLAGGAITEGEAAQGIGAWLSANKGIVSEDQARRVLGPGNSANYDAEIKAAYGSGVVVPDGDAETTPDDNMPPPIPDSNGPPAPRFSPAPAPAPIPVSTGLDPDETMEGRAQGLMSTDNPLMRLANTYGIQSANKRGLADSGLAGEYGMKAYLQNAVLPIAGQDAAAMQAQKLGIMEGDIQANRDASLYGYDVNLTNLEGDIQTGRDAALHGYDMELTQFEGVTQDWLNMNTSQRTEVRDHLAQTFDLELQDKYLSNVLAEGASRHGWTLAEALENNKLANETFATNLGLTLNADLSKMSYTDMLQDKNLIADNLSDFELSVINSMMTVGAEDLATAFKAGGADAATTRMKEYVTAAKGIAESLEIGKYYESDWASFLDVIPGLAN